MNYRDQYQLSDLPIVPRLAYLGLLTSFGLATIAKTCLVLLQIAFPLIDPKHKTWFYLLLTIVWTPAIIGFCCGYLTIARYPNLSKFIQIRDPIITTKDSYVWSILGIALILMSFLTAFALFGAETIGLKIWMLYLASTFFFSGLLCTVYDREKHVVVATFLDVTLGFGVVLMPVYLPAIILGWWIYGQRSRHQTDSSTDA